jgi:hypothetical protein
MRPKAGGKNCLFLTGIHLTTVGRSFSAMNQSKKKHFFCSVILIITSIFLTLLLVEVVLHNISAVDIERSLYHRIPDPVLGWVLKPNLSFVDRISGEDIQVHYNSKGFHDLEHAFKNEQRKFRIVVLGDSFMEAYSVRLDQAFSRLLEQLARNRGIDIEVINLGVGGYGTLQEYLMFQQIGKEYRPDIVLLAFFLGNDVRNNSFELESIASADSPLKVRSRPFLVSSDAKNWQITLVDYAGAQRRYMEAQVQKDSFLAILERRSILIHSLMRALNRSPALSDGNPDYSRENDKKSEYLAKLGVYYCQEPPVYTKAWNNTQRILERLRNEVTGMGSKLVVFTVPAQNEVDVRAMKKAVKNVGEPGIICLENASGYTRLQDILHELDIEYTDLLPAFRNFMQNGGRSPFHRRDGHWNKAGHNIAANAVFSFLLKKNLLPAGESEKQRLTGSRLEKISIAHRHKKSNIHTETVR